MKHLEIITISHNKVKQFQIKPFAEARSERRRRGGKRKEKLEGRTRESKSSFIKIENSFS